MHIGLDLRFLSDDLYSVFIIQLVKGLLYYDKNNQYIIYLNKNISADFDSPNVSTHIVNIQNYSLKEQTHFLKILNKASLDLVIFFHAAKPIFYSKKYFTFIPSLKDIYYQNFSNYFVKYRYLFLLEQNLKKAKKVVCFDQNTKDELIERINIKEGQINIIKPFFENHDFSLLKEETSIDIFGKFSLSQEYLIYSGGDGIEKNLDRLINVFYRLKKEDISLDLVVLGEETSKNINLRNLIIQYNLQDRVHFLGVVTKTEKKLLYAKSLGIIFPSLYEPFPFHIAESIHSQKPVITSKIKNLEQIFGNNAYYFSPISSNSIVETIHNFLKDKTKKIPDLESIINNYNTDISTGDLLEIINNR